MQKAQEVAERALPCRRLRQTSEYAVDVLRDLGIIGV